MNWFHLGSGTPRSDFPTRSGKGDGRSLGPCEKPSPPAPLPKGEGSCRRRRGTEMRRKWSEMCEMVQIMGRPKKVVLVWLKESYSHYSPCFRRCHTLVQVKRYTPMVANMAKKLRKSTSSGTPMVAQKSLGATIGHGAEPGKEPYGKGLATRPSPDSCAGRGNMVGEALRRARAGQPLT